VRDLELDLIDSKAQLDRKLAAVKEAIGSKVERDIKTMESRQAQQDSLVTQNFSVASEQF